MKLIVFLFLFLIPCFLTCLNCRRRKTCEDDTWTLINRTLGPWCVKVIPCYLNMTMAEQTCAQVGAVLSSVESQAELDVEVNLLIEQNITDAYVGATMRPECACTNFTTPYDDCPNTSNCSLYNAFVWSDNFTVGDSMMSQLNPGLNLALYFQYVEIGFHYGTAGLYTISDPLLIYYQNSTVFGALCGKRAT